jgi:two-component system, OmpR family, response regulator
MSKDEQKIRIFSALEVANICGVVNQTAINWIRNGYLKAFTTPGGQYRVYAEDLMKFLESRGMRIPAELSDQLREDVAWNSFLIIDDDKMFNDLVRNFIQREFPLFNIIQAFDGFDAGRLLLEKRPGFVALDLNLPGVDGHALCKRIKDDPIFGKPFVIAVTGYNTAEERTLILQEGADAFLGKPFDFKAFSAIIRELNGRIQP